MTKLVKYSIAWVIVAVLLLIVGFIFCCIIEYHIENLLEIQFANSWESLNKLLRPYSIERIKNHLCLDNIFIVIYTLLFLISIKILSLSIGKKIPWYLYVACFFPAIADFIENYQFYQFLTDLNLDQDITWFYYAVRWKWGLLIFFLLVNVTIICYYGLYVLVGVIDRIKQFIRFIRNKIKH